MLKKVLLSFLSICAFATIMNGSVISCSYAAEEGDVDGEEAPMDPMDSDESQPDE